MYKCEYEGKSEYLYTFREDLSDDVRLFRINTKDANKIIDKQYNYEKIIHIIGKRFIRYAYIVKEINDYFEKNDQEHNTTENKKDEITCLEQSSARKQESGRQVSNKQESRRLKKYFRNYPM